MADLEEGVPEGAVGRNIGVSDLTLSLTKDLS